MDKLANDVLLFMRGKGMNLQGSVLVTAFSGGADSVCLLHLLHGLRGLLKPAVFAAVHVDHGLRGAEGARDAAFCRAFCEARGILFRTVCVDVMAEVARGTTSVEEAARNLRYAALCREAETLRDAYAAASGTDGGKEKETEGELAEKQAGKQAGKQNRIPVYIAAAHHADDQAETILLNLLRGGGLAGLAGMDAQRPLSETVFLIRPLLFAERRRILDYDARHGLSFVTDSTNASSEFTRNRIRNELMPLFSEINPGAARHLAAAGERCREADLYFKQEAAAYCDENLVFSGSFGVRIGQKVLKEKNRILRGYVIMETLRRLSVPLKDWGERQFAAIDAALFAPSGYHLDLPGGVTVQNEYKETVLYHNNK